MKQAQDGDTVRIHYTGTLEDGTQFDSSSGREPIEFTLGSHSVIPGFEEGVKGMQVGEQKHAPAGAESQRRELQRRGHGALRGDRYPRR